MSFFVFFIIFLDLCYKLLYILSKNYLFYIKNLKNIIKNIPILYYRDILSYFIFFNIQLVASFLALSIPFFIGYTKSNLETILLPFKTSS